MGCLHCRMPMRRRLPLRLQNQQPLLNRAEHHLHQQKVQRQPQSQPQHKPQNLLHLLLLPQSLRAERLQLHLQVQNLLFQLRTLNPPVRHILLRQVHPRAPHQLLLHPIQVRLLRLNLRLRPAQLLFQHQNPLHLPNRVQLQPRLQSLHLPNQRLPRLNPPNNPPSQQTIQRPQQPLPRPQKIHQQPPFKKKLKAQL